MSRPQPQKGCIRRIKHLLYGFLAIAIISGAGASSGFAQAPVENVILLKFTNEAFSGVKFQLINGVVQTGIQNLDNLGRQFRLLKAERIFRHSPKFEARHEQFGLNRFYKFTFEEGADIETAVSLFGNDASIEFAQRSRKYELHRGKEKKKINFIPNDPKFGDQWHYHNTGQTGGTIDADIDAPEAWDVETGDPTVIVSDLDTGQDLDHPDLAANIWVNPGEIPGNNIDDDGNGYIDDVNGWDFSDNDNNPDDFDNHGSHTMGTVAAVTDNGVGVAGVAHDSRVMPCKIFPNASDPVISEAFTYAADNGSIVSTNSWGYSLPGPPSPVIEAAIDYFLATTNGVVVFSAGNANSDDPTWGYPGSYPPVIAVAATNHNDIKAGFSNYGTWVDVSAPGVNVWSTVIGGYASFQGTSMACPHVAGIAALIFAANPGITGADVRAQIEGSTDFIDNLNPGFEGLLGTGRVNAFQALSGGPFPKAPTNLQATVVGDSVDLVWIDPTQNTDGSPINLDHITVYREGSQIAQVGPGVQSYTDPDLLPGQHSYFVRATNVEGFESGPSNLENVLIGDFDVLVWQHPEVTQVNVQAKAAERGISVAEVEAMISEPKSGQAILDALTAIGKNPVLVTDIAGIDLSPFEGVFVVLGIFPNNHVILNGSDEAIAIEAYILSGHPVYMEGGDVWFYDPQFLGGHDFNALFGINPLDDGSGDLATVLGVPGTFTEGMNFPYAGDNDYIDHLAAVAPAFTIHQNSLPSYDCGIAHDAGTYKTIGNSFQFSGLTDNTATKDDLMVEYVKFLGIPAAPAEAIIWIPDDVLEPNLMEKASQRGFTLDQVQTLKVEIRSHLELEAALQANGKTVQIVNDLTTTDLSQTEYLFIVLGIYPNNHVIKDTDPEPQKILNFMTSGGKVYMEGGDVWYYDPLNLNGFDFNTIFGIDAVADGKNDLKTVLGSCVIETLDFVYKGVNNFIDHIVPRPGACQFHQNFAPDYGCGVGNDPGNGSRTVGLSFQFGGLDDNSLSSATKTELMQEYLLYFDVGPSCQITVLSPNGGENIVAGSTFEIIWTSASTSGFVTLELSTDGGVTYSVIAANEPDDGSYMWSVPNITSGNCLVKISDANDPNCKDESDGEFSIGPPDVGWIAPISVNAIATQANDFPDIKNFDLTFGGHPAATDGFDLGLDIPAPPPSFNYYAYFFISAFPNFLSQDIRGWVPPYEADIDWSLKVINAAAITSEVCWEPDSLPPQGTFTLIDTILQEISVNMRTQNCVQFTGDANLIIEYREEKCVLFDFPVADGAWYMISLPVIPPDGSLATLFPDALAAFGWDYSTQNYVSASILQPERAYWVLFLQASQAEVCGVPLDTYTNAYNEAGWDMIGAVWETSPLIDDPEGAVISVFGWDPTDQNYVPIPDQVLQPQQGYWALIFTVPSTITVGGGATSSLAKSGAITADLAAAVEKFGALPPAPPYSIEEMQAKFLPQSFGLAQNYPNPFNPETVIEYWLPATSEITLKIYTILGQEIRTLVAGQMPAGAHRVKWDARNDAGQVVAPGIYLYRLEAGDFSQTRKLALIK